MWSEKCKADSFLSTFWKVKSDSQHLHLLYLSRFPHTAYTSKNTPQLMLIPKQSETKVKGNSSRYLRNALVGVTDTLCRSQLLMEDVEWFMGRSSVEANGGIQSYYQLCGESISRKYDTWLQSVAQEARALLVFSGDQGLFDHIQLLSVIVLKGGRY